MSKSNLENEVAAAGRDLYSGLIRLHVLHHAAEEPIFGLGMIEELARHGYRISPGSLYPLLRGLEKKGYLRSTEKRDGKSFRRLYPTVKWPDRRSHPSLFVPKTSVVITTERTFVVRNRSGQAEWVDVKKGVSDGEMVEVMAKLQPGDKVVRRATDEIRDGTSLPAGGTKAP
jgi:PadR family transcriptional regulator PadR